MKHSAPGSLRVRYLVVAMVTVAAGLLVHLHGVALPAAARDVTGDALWAALIFWSVAVVAPTAEQRSRVLVAIVICVTVEVSQLARPEWLELWRSTTIGHLTLGSDFDKRDLLAYGAGVVAAALLERRIVPDVADQQR